MRKRFHSPALKQHFAAAWSCLPEKTRRDLHGFIRQVREVAQLEGSYVGCPDGTRYGPLADGAGFAFWYQDDSVAFCDILLETQLAKDTRSQAIAMILHELAHVCDYFVSGQEMMKLSSFTADMAAWDQAILWASAGIPDHGLSQEIEYWALDAKIHIQAAYLAELAASTRRKKGG